MPHIEFPTSTARAALCGTLAAVALLCAPAPAPAATQVSYSALLAQVRSGPVIRAVINRRGGDVEIKFQDLSEWKANFPPGAQPALQRLLRQRHIRVIFASRHRRQRVRPAAVHHHLRYIAAGIAAALVLIAAAVLLLRHRSQRARAPSPPAQPPAG
jgi:hypothetical protein